MMSEAPIATATSAGGSMELADDVPVNAQLSTLNSVKERGSHGALRSQLSAPRIALLTGGGDKPYALGMAAALTSAGVDVDFIGSDDLSVPELLNNPRVNFRNLRGDQRSEASLAAKIARVAIYYGRLIRFAATAK